MDDQTDSALFEATTAPAAPAAAEPAVSIEQSPAPQPAAEAKPAAPAQEAEQRVPLHELLSERRTRQALEKRIEELSKQAEPAKKADLFDNPSQFVREEMDQGLQRDRAAAAYNSQLIAEARFGEDVVKAAMKAFDGLIETGQIKPLEHARVYNSPNPFAEAVKWHKEHQVQAEVGSDLPAYRAKLRAELLADPEFRKEADAAWRAQAVRDTGTGQFIRPAVPSTPSLSRIGGAALAPAGEEQVSDEELFKQATSRKRR